MKENKKSGEKLLIFEAFLYMIMLEGCFGVIRGGNGMLNYEEELAKFQPSLEIDEAEEAILNNDLTDLSDLLDQVVTGKQEKR